MRIFPRAGAKMSVILALVAAAAGLIAVAPAFA
jgi:hypothetical protein